MKILAIGVTKRQKCDQCHTKVSIDVKTDLFTERGFLRWKCPFCQYDNYPSKRFY